MWASCDQIQTSHSSKHFQITCQSNPKGILEN